jgi:signal transduction histidine kinase
MIWKSLSPFQIARLQLTTWYTLLGAILLILFTYFTFEARNTAYLRVYRVLDANSPGSRQVVEFEDKYRQLNREFQERLILFDIALFIVLTGASYYFSGKTLEPIQKMTEEQAAFAADVSHSLRTPLATMKLEIDAFARSRLRIPRDMTEVLKSLREEITHMTNITEGLLTLVRADNRTVFKSWQPVSIQEVIEIAMSSLHPLAAANHWLQPKISDWKEKCRFKRTSSVTPIN